MLLSPANSERGAFVTEKMTATDGKTDFDQLSRWAAQAQTGDAGAYERLLRELYAFVRMVLRARLGYVAELDDLTQECLLGVHKSLRTYHPSRPLKPWVQAIIRYKVADHFRALGRRRELTLPVEQIDVTNAAAETNASDEGRRPERVDLRALIARLPDRLRRAVVLTQIDGLSGAEAAAREDIGEAALRKRVSRAYKRLATMVEKELEADDRRER